MDLDWVIQLFWTEVLLPPPSLQVLSVEKVLLAPSSGLILKKN